MAPDDGPNYEADDGYQAHPPATPIHDLAARIHKISVDHGFWPAGTRNIGEAIALIHSEASEALEEHRSHGKALYYRSQPYGPKKPEGVLVEYMDIIIRTLDLAYKAAEDEGISLDSVLNNKVKFNESRPHKHGRNY